MHGAALVSAKNVGPQMNRQLAAILAADIAGYSALMAEDEARTLEDLRRLRRELFHPAVAAHRGRVVKSMGDGWLVSFSSAVEAVNCAVQIQSGLERDLRIRLRMGLHLGDITHEDEDIFGDGVNVAARLEALADPGALVISDAVHCALDATLTPGFADAGERSLKNIPQPMRVWVRGGQVSDAMPPALTGDLPASFPVVAIQPFSTPDSRDEVVELAAALTGDLAAYLNRGGWLTGFAAETPPPETFRLTGVLRARGERLRLEVTLTGRDDASIWTGRIDGALADSFDWQDSAGADVASGVYAAIQSAEIDRITAIPEDLQDSETSFLLAKLHGTFTAGSIERHFRAIEQAITRAPDWAQAHAYAAFMASSNRIWGFRSAAGNLPDRLDALIEKGRRHKASDLESMVCVAWSEYMMHQTAEAFLATVDAVLKRVPGHILALNLGAACAIYHGMPELAESYTKKQRILTEKAVADTDMIVAAGLVQMGRDEEALAAIRKNRVHSPEGIVGLRVLASALSHLGKQQEARLAVQELLRLAPEQNLRTARGLYTADTPGIRRYLDGLRMAGLPEG